MLFILLLIMRCTVIGYYCVAIGIVLKLELLYSCYWEFVTVVTFVVVVDCCVVCVLCVDCCVVCVVVVDCCVVVLSFCLQEPERIHRGSPNHLKQRTPSRTCLDSCQSALH